MSEVLRSISWPVIEDFLSGNESSRREIAEAMRVGLEEATATMQPFSRAREAAAKPIPEVPPMTRMWWLVIAGILSLEKAIENIQVCWGECLWICEQ